MYYQESLNCSVKLFQIQYIFINVLQESHIDQIKIEALIFISV